MSPSKKTPLDLLLDLGLTSLSSSHHRPEPIVLLHVLTLHLSVGWEIIDYTVCVTVGTCGHLLPSHCCCKHTWVIHWTSLKRSWKHSSWSLKDMKGVMLWHLRPPTYLISYSSSSFFPLRTLLLKSFQMCQWIRTLLSDPLIYSASLYGNIPCFRSWYKLPSSPLLLLFTQILLKSSLILLEILNPWAGLPLKWASEPPGLP